VLERGWFVLGEEVEAFEAEFAQHLGAGDAVGVASGTDAIELALRALGIGSGDEVITQANTCVPTVAAIERAGATAVLCDAEAGAATMDPASLEMAITPRTTAVVPVHLYGQCADLDAIGAIAERRGLAVVEDCAQATGAEFRGRAAGTIGAIGCFSFYPTKNLAAFGDAGAVVSSDPMLVARLRRLRNYGLDDDGSYVDTGVNSRMDELQAAVLRVKLTVLAARNKRRREIAHIYMEALAESSTSPLAHLDARVHAYHQFVALSEKRDNFRERMAERGVATLVHYPTPIHHHPAYAHLVGEVPLGVSERLCDRVVSLPVYPELTTDEVDAVATAARESA
jgi:dTDP-3-amino-3,4,6-trideoxy-alpha-D-glucose transaminase